MADSGWFAALVGTAVGGTGLWGWLSERAKTRRSPPADMATATATLQAAVSAAAKGLIADYQDQLRFVRARCDQLEHDHAELKVKVNSCEDRHADCERNLNRLQQQIDQLARSPVAQQGDKASADV